MTRPHSVNKGIIADKITANGPFAVGDHSRADTRSEEVMTEYKNYGQAGAFGENARSDKNTFSQSRVSKPFELEELADQLNRVRIEMKKRANPDDAVQDAEIGTLAQAEKAAKSGDQSKALEFLKSAGGWTIEVAKSVAAGLVKDAVEGKFHI